MADKMTKIEGVPDRKEIKPGMAHYAETGPFGTVCGECLHRGYERDGRTYFDDSTQTYITKTRRTGGCHKYRKLTGNDGPVVESSWPSCKYFERRPEEPKA